MKMKLLDLKPDDIVYYATPNGVDTLKVTDVYGDKLSPFVECERIGVTNYYSRIRQYVHFRYDEFGKLLFSSKEEADAKCEQLKRKTNAG